MVGGSVSGVLVPVVGGSGSEDNCAVTSHNGSNAEGDEVLQEKKSETTVGGSTSDNGVYGGGGSDSTTGGDNGK